MEEQNSTDLPKYEVTASPKTKNKKKMMLLITAAVLLATAPAAGVYFWQRNTKTNSQAAVNSDGTPTMNVDVAHQTAKDIFPSSSRTAPAYDPKTTTTDTTMGYPRNLPDKAIKTTLVLPGGYGIVADWPRTTSQAELNAYYVTAFNDVIGYWVANLKGTAATPSKPLTRKFTITAFNEWLKENDKSDYYYDVGEGQSGPLNTTQKQAFVKDLKDKTTQCAKDSAKGFVTNDGVYKVCYSVSQGHAEGADSVMSIEGYAEVEGTLLYMRSYFDLPSSNTSAAQDYVKALKQITTVVEKR